MKLQANTVTEYLNQIPNDRKEEFQKLYRTLKDTLPKELEEAYLYDMITFAVPFSIYPNGYHAKKDTPLPFIALALQSKTINLYHMGLYSDPVVLEWYQSRYQELIGKKPNMGKSCLRFSKIDESIITIVFELLQKQSFKEYVAYYDQKRP